MPSARGRVTLPTASFALRASVSRSAANALFRLWQELADEVCSLLMLNKKNDYIFKTRTRVTIDGIEETLLACPHGHITLGSATAVHSHWIAAKWPCVALTQTQGGVFGPVRALINATVLA